jgi:FtsP/CotA-like multicopper oxidase with cupredoxin domain
MSSCLNNQINDAKYWKWLVIAGIIIVIIVIIVMVLTMEGTTTKIPPQPLKCKSAEYPTFAENTSCDPNIVEVSLTASDNEVQILNGDTTKLYNYNKSFPGPLIEAKKGDTLIVHFFNDICEPTTITWHGLLTPANMDGSQISSFPIMPGDSFDYKFTLLNAGLFWYHSDINSRYQVQKGLYGVILVKDYEEDSCYNLPETEKVLAFSDLKLNSSNQVDIEYSSVPCERIYQQINGIVGNVLLTNGVYQGCINLVKDEPVRLYLVNCATDRFMKIFLEGHDMLRIGGDQGLLEKPVLIKEENGLMLTTGERAEIVFVPRKEKIGIYTESNPRGVQKVISDDCGNCELTDEVTKSEEKVLLVTFNVYEEKEKCSDLEVPLKLKKIRKIKTDHCTPVIPVHYGEYICDDVEYFAYEVCKTGTPFQDLNAKDAPIVFEDGTYIIEVTNTSPLANNFYLHGFTFQHIDTLLISDGNKERIINQVIENKDTIYIPARPYGRRAKTVVRLAVKFSSDCRNIVAFGKEPTEKRSGGWIFQSHVLTNASLGQEGFIQIVGKCERDKYSSHSGYIDSFSSYNDTSHSTCLTRSSNFSNSSRSSDLSNTLEELTQSLITCKCGSGISSSICSCSSSNMSTSSLNTSLNTSLSTSLNTSLNTSLSTSLNTSLSTSSLNSTFEYN